jgi:RHS repeat-associated protein
MTAVTDPDGITTTYTYTPLNLTATASYSGSSAHSVTYTYDADRNQTGMTDGSGTSSSFYDSFGELTSATNGAGQTVTYGYDADGDNTSIGYPLPAAATWATSDSVSYGYDDADQLTSATDFNGNKIAITSTADGLPSAETLGSTGDSIITGYDQTDNPSSIALENSSSTLQSFTYADAPGGETLTETDTPSSSGSPAAYGYDAQGRVTSLTPGSGTASSYGFDASGNLTTLPGGAAGTYDNGGELTSSALAGTTTTHTYNADGERLGSAQGSTVTSATWNGAGQLTGYDSPAADMTAAAYNGDGLRASDTTGGTSQDFAWNGDKLLMDGASAYIYAAGTTPAEQVSLSTGTVTYLVSDALGSVRGTVSSTGALTGTTSYDAWGNPSTAAGLTAATPFGYAGAYIDPDGLLYLINRYYDPATGQFISVDPYLDQTNAPYTYADGNPVTNTDPTGLTGLNDKPGVLGRSYCVHVVSAQHWNGQVCAQVYVSGLENTLAQAQVVFKVNSGDIYYAAVDTLALEACSNTGPHPGHPVDCKWGYEDSSGAFYTDVKNFTVSTAGKFRAIYVTWFRAYAEGVTMVWTNGQYVTGGSVFGYLEEDGNGG